MVVLSVGMEPPAQAALVAKRLGIALNAYGFCETDKFSPLETNRPGVYVCGAFQSPKEIAESIMDASGAAAEVMRLLSTKIDRAPHSREHPFLARNGEFPPEREVSDEPPRVGVFVCACGDAISRVVNTDALTAFAEKLPAVTHAEQMTYLCLPEGQARMRRSIEERGVNRVVVAACSHRTHESFFQRTVREVRLNPYLLEMANIREHCAWAHRRDPEGATRKAKEMVRLAVSRAARLAPVRKESLQPIPRALVIGGGVAGMTAALAVADSGYEVVLVERSEMLGGNLNNLYFTAEGGNPQRLLRDLVNRVVGHDRIRIFTRSEVIEHRGHVGAFRSVLATRVKGAAAPARSVIEHGVTIVATGGQEQRSGEYLLGV